MIELVPATHEDRFFIARVTRAAIPLFEPIQPGVFGPLAVRIENDGLFKEYDSYIIRYSNDRRFERDSDNSSVRCCHFFCDKDCGNIDDENCVTGNRDEEPAESVPVGFLGLAALTPEITYMVALFFLPEYRGRELGTEVLQTLEKNLPDKGVRELILLVHRQADWAIGFYRKNGYSVLAETEEAMTAYAGGEMKKWLMPGFILMGKRLDI